MSACCLGSCGKVVGGALAIGMIGIGAALVQSQFQPVAVTLSQATPPAPPAPSNAGANTANPSSPENPPPAPAGDGQGAAPVASPPGGAVPAVPQGTEPAPVDPATLGKVVTAAQAKALHDQGGVIFIDARSAAEYEAGHIPAAFLLSMDAWDAPETKETLDFVVGFQNDPMVLYCKSPQCDASENLAILLEQAGFKRLHVMKEGFDAWTAAGYPVATGKE